MPGSPSKYHIFINLWQVNHVNIKKTKKKKSIKGLKCNNESFGGHCYKITTNSKSIKKKAGKQRVPRFSSPFSLISFVLKQRERERGSEKE